MAARRSSGSIPMPRRYSWPAAALSRSSAPCGFRSSIIPPSPNARPPAWPSSRSIIPMRRQSTAARWRSRARTTARWPSAARAHRWNGRGRCGVSTRCRRSIIWLRRGGSTTRSPTRSGGPWRARTRRRRSPRPPVSPMRSPRSSPRTLLSCARRLARCHGDLHLGNIVLLDGAPVLFDAIEFDPKIATSDVLYDLAFLLMDLIERKLTPAANIVLNCYLNETRRAEDLDALAALPLFLSLRAAIRAKVAAARRALSAARAGAEQSARD